MQRDQMTENYPGPAHLGEQVGRTEQAALVLISKYRNDVCSNDNVDDVYA